MKRARSVPVIVGMALVLFVVGGIGIPRLVRSSPPPASLHTARPAAAAAAGGAPFVQGSTLAQIIAGLQARLRSIPGDWESFAQLGLAYVQQARVTADPSYYPKAQGALDRSLALNATSNFDAMTGQAALAAARHDFAGALDWGEQARAINPYDASVYAVIGDAEIELGRYPRAFQTLQRAVDLRPDLSTYSRASYAWELQGNIPFAIRAMNLALGAAGNAADAAWALNQLGELYWNRGDLARAQAYYEQAARQDPTFLPPAANLAKVEAARGRVDRAIADYRAVVARYPLPAYVIALDDLYTITGRTQEAEQQTALVGAEEKLFQANGVNVDLEIALFDADHGVDPAGGLAAAQAEWARRHSVFVADALGWALYRNGRVREALPYANAALHLGSRNALFSFHRGMIERALGMRADARRDLAAAIDINPFFSVLWSSPAAHALAALGGEP